MNNNITNIERIIAKIDNDFNPDQSDWIPRVGAWTIDAMSTLKVLKRKTKRRKLNVQDRIAYSPCEINTDNLIVIDKNGCKIEHNKDGAINDCCSSTGKISQENTSSSSTTSIIVQEPNYTPDNTIFQQINEKDYPARYNVIEQNRYNKNNNRNYVIIDSNKLELNFDTDYIYIESEEIVTTCSSVYGCELPVIPNNGLLIEAIVSWCMYKMLCRGYKHTVLNLRDNSPATNPYISWLQLKEQAKTSLILDAQGEAIDDGGAWRSAFYIFSFDHKR